MWLTAAVAGMGCDLVMPPRPVLRPPSAAQSPELDRIVRPADALVDGKLRLGFPSLTAGITGDGPLTLPEVERWLADPKNHEPIEFVLPLGLRELADQVRIPPDNPLTRAKIELGRQLFVDLRLSDPTRRHACFHCHMPARSFTGMDLHGDPAAGVPMRTAPTVVNRLFSDAQFWDGRAETLEKQVTEPIFSPYEMNNTPQGLVAFLEGKPGYKRQFEVIFGGVSVEAVGKALASFVRVLVTGESPYDYWRELEAWKGRDLAAASETERKQHERLLELASQSPFSAAARRGYELFMGKAGCANCHAGPNFTDEKYHNLGAGMEEADPDLGRFRVTGRPEDRGAFKTPTLRNVALTSGYMHRNQLATLEAVVDWVAGGGTPNPHLDPLVKKLELTPRERQQLVAFLNALTGPATPVALGRMPE